MRDVIEQYLHIIHNLNPNSIKCTEMAKIFIDYFDIKQRKTEDFINYEKIK